MPRLLHDIVHAILATQPDIQLAAEPHGVPANEMARLDALDHADVAIVSASEMENVDYDALLYAHPRLRLVAIAGDGKGGAVYELLPSRVALGEFSPEVLVDAIRSKAMSGRLV